MYSYWIDKQDKLRPYTECQFIPYCQQSCDYNRRVLAKEVARRIFKNNIGNGCKDAQKLKDVLNHISNLIQDELNDEPFSRELLSCVKIYIWRYVKYDTLLRIPQVVMDNSIKKM